MGNYLVTGGAGFIGAAVADRLVADGHRVIVLDNLTTGYRDNVPERAEFFVGDCQDQSVYGRLPQTPYDAIYHIAGQSSGEISFDDPVYDLQANTQSTLLLLQFARQVACPTLLYASSMSVYGEQSHAPVDEDAVPVPNSCYGVGKLASEHYLRIYARYGIRSVALRIFNVYGPGQNLANLRQGMVSIFLAQALRSRHIEIKGPAERYRDFVYITDVVEAFLTAERRAPDGFSVYNVGTGARTTVKALIDALVSLLPFAVTTEYGPGTPGDQFGITAGPTAIHQALGWKGGTTLHEGLQQMVSWALQQRLGTERPSHAASSRSKS